IRRSANLVPSSSRDLEGAEAIEIDYRTGTVVVRLNVIDTDDEGAQRRRRCCQIGAGYLIDRELLKTWAIVGAAMTAIGYLVGRIKRQIQPADSRWGHVGFLLDRRASASASAGRMRAKWDRYPARWACGHRWW